MLGFPQHLGCKQLEDQTNKVPGTMILYALSYRCAWWELAIRFVVGGWVGVWVEFELFMLIDELKR